MRKLQPDMFQTKSGSPELPVFRSKVEKDGQIVPEQKGTKNIQEYIQSFKDSCSIHLILARCANGDFSGLSAKQGMYGDTTKFPKTYAQVLQSVIDGKNLFASLPQDIRDAFGNDFEKWYAQTGTDEWFTKMKGRKDVVVPEVSTSDESVSKESKE